MLIHENQGKRRYKYGCMYHLDTNGLFKHLSLTLNHFPERELPFYDYSISELAEEFDITTRSIRYYEEKKLERYNPLSFLTASYAS